MKVDGHRLRWDGVVSFALNPAEKVELEDWVLDRVRASRKRLERHMHGTIYGVNTGFGALAQTRINAEDLRRLQENLIKSHHSGAGSFEPPEVGRAAALIRLNSLVKGYSGVRIELVEAIKNFLNAGLAPCMPEYGSVGASGDLAPLASFALALSLPRHSKVWRWKDGWECVDGERALKEAGLKPVELAEKEALSLINGTPFSTAIALFALHYAKEALETCEISAALSLQALLGDEAPFFQAIHRIRNLRGQQDSADRVRRLLRGSQFTGRSGAVQDPYSFRCHSQVVGAAREALYLSERILQGEVNAATDNPLVFEEGVFSGGNFHGQPVALASDLICIALSYIAGISERRTFALLDPKLNRGLPPFLAENPGLNSGLMIAQYTAASLAAEIRQMAAPASVHSIPTSADQEDFVSMSAAAARKAREAARKAIRVLAVELVCACQALDMRGGLEGLSAVTQKVYRMVRERVPYIKEDAPLYDYIESVASLIEEGLSKKVL